MTGRGRGWMRSEASDFRRPGQANKLPNVSQSVKPIKNEECNQIINLIEKLEINECTTEVEVHEIEAVLIDAAKNNKLK